VPYRISDLSKESEYGVAEWIQVAKKMGSCEYGNEWGVCSEVP
jgi:hypothetical protein